MTLAFILAIAFTIGVSALCSVLEAMILSTTTAEIEGLKKINPNRGKKLEKYKIGLEETSSAISQPKYYSEYIRCNYGRRACCTDMAI